MTAINQQTILSAITTALLGLVSKPEEDEAPAKGWEFSKQLPVPPIPGATVHATAVSKSKWLMQALSQMESAGLNDRSVATVSRGDTITDPAKFRRLIQRATGIELVPGPVLKLRGQEKHCAPGNRYPRAVVERQLVTCLVSYYYDVSFPASRTFSDVSNAIITAMEEGRILYNEFIHDLLAHWDLFDDKHIWPHLCNHIAIDINEIMFRDSVKEQEQALEDKIKAEAAAQAASESEALPNSTGSKAVANVSAAVATASQVASEASST